MDEAANPKNVQTLVVHCRKCIQAVNGNYDRSAATLEGLSGDGQIHKLNLQKKIQKKKIMI
jgi:hypothetical protein